MGGQGTQTYMDRNEICTLYNCPFGAGGSQETLLSSLNVSVHVLHGSSQDRLRIVKLHRRDVYWA